MFYILFCSLLFIIVLPLYLMRRKSVLLSRTIKVLTVVFMIMMFLNIFLPDGFVISISQETLASNNHFFEALIRWFRFVGFLVIPIAIFKDK